MEFFTTKSFCNAFIILWHLYLVEQKYTEGFANKLYNLRIRNRVTLLVTWSAMP